MSSAATRSSATAAHGAVLAGVAAFFALGVPDGGNGVAWPFMRAALHQPLDAFGLLTVAATAGAVGASALTGRLARRWGSAALLLAAAVGSGAALAGVGLSPGWLSVVLCFAVLGTGGGLIDALVQAHAVARHGMRSMGALHAGYGVGAAVGPLLMTAVLSTGLGWRAGFFVMAALYALVVPALLLTRQSWTAPAPASAPALRRPRRPSTRLLLLFFLVTSLEASAGLWAFTFLTGARGLGTAVAGVAVGAFFGVQTLTRVVLAAVGHRVAAATVLRVCVATTVVGMALTLLPQALSIIGLLIAGLGMGGVYPALMVSSGAQLAHGEAEAAVGYQVAAANAGFAAGSALTGVVLAHVGLGTFPAVELLLVAAVAVLLALSTRRARRSR